MASLIEASPSHEAFAVPVALPRRRWVAIDTETTGFGHIGKPPRDDAIIQVGIAWRDDAGMVQQWSETCYPHPSMLVDGRAMKALEVNKLTLGEVLAARTDKEVSATLWEKLAALRPLTLRAYNVAFDRPFLSREPWQLVEEWGPCIMLQAQERLGTDRWPKLSAAAKALGIDVEGLTLHNAGTDAHLALLIAEKLDSIQAKAGMISSIRP